MKKKSFIFSILLFFAAAVAAFSWFLLRPLGEIQSIVAFIVVFILAALVASRWTNKINYAIS